MFKSLIMHISTYGTAALAALSSCCICILFTYPQLVKKQLNKLYFVQQQYSIHKRIRRFSLKTIYELLSSGKLSLSGDRFVHSSVAGHLLNAYDAGWNMNAVQGRN